MSEHRMFSNRIANSAKFLQMPAESQLLYFHMILRADDDGVVEAYPLMKLLGSAPDVFKVLIAKGFIRQLNEDQVVVIPDWLEHNTIRADRKVNSIYYNLLKENYPDLRLIEPKPRSDVEDNSRRLQVDSPRSAEVKLSKVKIREDNTNTSDTSVAGIPAVIKSFETVNPSIKSGKLYGNTTQRAAAENLIKLFGLEAVLLNAKKAVEILTQQYAPKVTTPYELEKNWAKVMAYNEQKGKQPDILKSNDPNKYDKFN